MACLISGELSCCEVEIRRDGKAALGSSRQPFGWKRQHRWGLPRVIGVGAPVSKAQASVPLIGDDEGVESHVWVQETDRRT